MTELIERLEATIKARGLTFNRVEHDLGLGNGTIKRWGEQSPRLDKLVAVADRLDVSLDYLVYGTLRTDSSPKGERELDLDLEAVKREQGLTCDGSPLTDAETDLVAMFRLLPSHEQEDVFDLLYFKKYKKYVEKKKESIYWTYFDESEEAKGGPGEDREGRAGTA